MDRLGKYGFVADENKNKLGCIFDSEMLSKVHIDLYTSNPYMLLSRIVEKNVDSIVENGRLILKKNDQVLINILIEHINDCFVMPCSLCVSTTRMSGYFSERRLYRLSAQYTERWQPPVHPKDTIRWVNPRRMNVST